MAIEQNKIPRIGIVGEFQSGKSTLINCLLENRVAISGIGIATTKQVTRYYFSEKIILHAFKKQADVPDISKENITREDFEKIILNHDIAFCELGMPCRLLKHVELWDTPGLNANDRDNKVTETFFEKLDYVFMLVSKGLKDSDIETLHLISKYKVPYTVLYNSTSEDQWDPDHISNRNICETCIAQMKQLGFESNIVIPEKSSVFSINTAWSWFDIVQNQKKNDDFILSPSAGEESLFRRVGNFLFFQHQIPDLKKASNVDVLRNFLTSDGLDFGKLHNQLEIYKEIFRFQKNFGNFFTEIVKKNEIF